MENHLPDLVDSSASSVQSGDRADGAGGESRGVTQSRARTPRLSKSRFQAGLQCHKKLWLKCFEPSLADPVDEIRQAIFDQGTRVGELARERYPGGVLVSEDYTQQAAALRTTRRLIEEGVPIVFEAAFEHDGVLVRADVIVRRPDGSWDLVEVKSTSKAKAEHVTDVAIQTHVLEGAGIEVATAAVLHLDTSYEYDGDSYDLDALFAVADVTEQARAFLPEIPAMLDSMKTMLSNGCPEIRIGKHCSQPYECDFRGHCHDFLPDFPVTEIPRIDGELLDALLSQGILSMRDVPLDHPGLNENQAAACELVREGEPRFLEGLAEVLLPLSAPLSFLDFETVAPAIPLYEGTRPYQQLAVQWSCHTLTTAGALEHREYLHTQRSDPRRAFAHSLLTAVPSEGPIVVYSSYENTILASLAADLPDLAPGLRLIQDRLFDLLPVVRAHVRHPRMLGRNSLKYVLPALVHDFSYEGLAIQNGASAGLRYAAALSDGFPENERACLFSALREYCAMDTLALVRLHQELVARAE
jgi:predicted RecB family nuclease